MYREIVERKKRKEKGKKKRMVCIVKCPYDDHFSLKTDVAYYHNIPHQCQNWDRKKSYKKKKRKREKDSNIAKRNKRKEKKAKKKRLSCFFTRLFSSSI